MERDDLRRHHLETCRFERHRLFAELEQHRAGAKTPISTDVAMRRKTEARLEAEIAQLSEIIARYEQALGGAKQPKA
jgi:hypothetical protein